MGGPFKLPALSTSGSTPLSLLLLLVILAAIVIYGLGMASLYDLRFLTIVCVYAIMVLGFQFIFGHVGAVSLAQSTFFGLGSYVTGLLGVTYGLDSAILLPLSIIAAVALAALIAVPVLRLEDHYFSLATLGVALVVQLTAVNWESLTGGLNGLSGIPGLQFFGIAIETRLGAFVCVWLALVAATIFAVRSLASLYGLSFNLVRESPNAAASLGIDVARLRFTAFLLSAGYGGAAGALMAQVLRVVSPENLDLSLMATCLIITVVGGSTRPIGAIIGALLIIFLRERFRIAQNYSLIAYTSATLLVLILAPYGIAGSAEKLWNRLRRREALVPFAADESSAGASEELPLPKAPAVHTNESILTVTGISKRFGGVQALDQVNVEVLEGEILGLIGPNGSGKTTLVNVITGLYVADAGDIFFRGQKISTLPPHDISALGIARTFQHIDLVGQLSAIDNIAIGAFRSEGASLRRSLPALGADPSLVRARARAVELAQALGFANVAGVPSSELPYGTRRRVEIARALASNPRFLLLDEPAAGLNEAEQADLARRIRQIADSGITILIIEHNLLFLGALATRLVCLDRGRVIAAGAPADVRADPRVVEAYLGEAA